MKQNSQTLDTNSIYIGIENLFSGAHAYKLFLHFWVERMLHHLEEGI